VTVIGGAWIGFWFYGMPFALTIFDPFRETNVYTMVDALSGQAWGCLALFLGVYFLKLRSWSCKLPRGIGLALAGFRRRLRDSLDLHSDFMAGNKRVWSMGAVTATAITAMYGVPIAVMLKNLRGAIGLRPQ